MKIRSIRRLTAGRIPPGIQGIIIIVLKKSRGRKGMTAALIYARMQLREREKPRKNEGMLREMNTDVNIER